ncbi:unnamed protein product, partial [Symbiodinium sp. KB8]
KGVDSFLTEAVSVDASFRQQCQSALADVERAHASELLQRAEDVFTKVSTFASELLPKIDSQEPLPKEMLCSLNATIAEAEARYAAVSVKSDVLPETLLNAELGSKLYPGLLKKVEAVCRRDMQELQKRELENFRALLRKGGLDDSFDAKVAQYAAERSRKLAEVIKVHEEALAHSDHRPLREQVQPGCSTLRILTWNTLEFPSLTGKVVQVIAAHAAYVEKVLVDALSTEVDVAFLQELNHEVAQKVRKSCLQKGWATTLSKANEDSGKCDAMTMVVSRQPIDEEQQVAVEVGKKKRHFAAARCGSTWFVSCHVPIVSDKKSPPNFQEDTAVQVLEQLSAELRGERIVAGGDWNAKVHEVAKQYKAKDKMPGLHAPRGPTCFDREYAIDGIFCLA